MEDMEDLGENLLIFQIHDSTLVAVVTKRFFVGWWQQIGEILKVLEFLTG